MTKLYWRTLLIPDKKPEKDDKTPNRTTSKVFEFQHTPLLTFVSIVWYI